MFERLHLAPQARRRSVHGPSEMQQWRAFVRQQLGRLADAGTVYVTADTVRDDAGASETGRVLRYIAAPQSDTGRAIVVPNADSLLPPLVLPPRATRDLLAPYTIQAYGKDKAVNVPWSRVLRDHKQTERKPRGICIGCSWGVNCAHGWTVPSPRSVVVLAVNDGHSTRQRVGWFVRFSDDSKKLIQVPRAVAKKLTWRMENDVVMCTSSLVSQFALESEDEYEAEFLNVAHAAYERIYDSIRASLKRRRDEEKESATPAKKPRVDDTATTDKGADDDSATCLVCLEDEPTVQPRCPRGQCSSNVCHDCHHKSRGLCPICDRTAINADYPCSGCGQLSRLQAYGFPCITCNACTLCKTCYTAYEECRPCENAALFRMRIDV